METLYRKYRRTQIAEMRPITQEEIDETLDFNISISNADFKNGSPKIGDMIARNPKNHDDQWLVAEQYFKDNFESIEETSDNSHQIEKLEADKAELLEVVRESFRVFEAMDLQKDFRKTLKSLIQKHKQ